MSRSRAWCFTLNNYTEEEQQVIRDVPCVYLIFGREKGEEGTPHLQGYIYFENAKTLKTLKKLLGPRAHVEVAKGNSVQNREYCSKQGDFEELGDCPHQGERKDLQVVCDNIKNGLTTVDLIALENPITYHKYGRTLAKVEDITLRKRFRNWMTEGVWYYGETGVGKSHRAYEGYSADTHYNWKYDGGWQDGYTGQEVVIVNEFRGQIPMCDLLMLVDKWPYEVRRRGREPAPFLAKKVIVTSSMDPAGVYVNMGHDKIEQLLRRFTVVHLSERYSSMGGARRSEATDTQQGSEATASAPPPGMQGSEATAQ